MDVLMATGSFMTKSPLRTSVLHILLALSEGDSHGLGIADQVERTSDGVVLLGPGTLYRSLDEMQEAGLITRTDPPSADADPRRKYYRITGRGNEVLRAEMERFQGLVEVARARKILGEGT